MNAYRAPVDEAAFLLHDVLRIGDYVDVPGFADLSRDNVAGVLTEAARLAQEVLAPLNPIGDAQGCRRDTQGGVMTPDGFAAAFRLVAEGGWGGLVVDAEAGGAGLPHVLGVAAAEFFNGANQSFAMYTNWGLYGSLLLEGDDAKALRDIYLPPLVSGEWLGTMAMTEPQAGTDLGLMRTRAVSESDGSYRLSGTKIFISGGEHDLTPNIIHFVLARIDGDAVGSQGISLFLVPKMVPDADGRLRANGIHCGSVEKKMGLNGSATCTMHFEDAKAWLIGAPGQGLKRMFRLMNHIRRMTGTIAIAGSDAALQRAAAYVKDRRQGRGLSRSHGRNSAADPLIEQPDVRRVLMTIRSFVEAGRLFVMWLSLQIDLLERSDDPALLTQAQGRLDLLTPVAKAVLSDMGFDCAIAAQQMFGGHGYITDTGIEQYPRDMRMLHLAEGANGVQAMDLVGRKLRRDGGAFLAEYLEECRMDIAALPEAAADVGSLLGDAVDCFQELAGEIVAAGDETASYAAYDFMTALGLIALGHMWVKIAQVAAPRQADPLHWARMARARFFMTHQLQQTVTCIARARAPHADIAELPVEAF